MSRLPDIQARVERGGEVDPANIPTDAELQKRAQGAFARFFYPELDPDALYARIQKLLVVNKPESEKSKKRLEPSITIPIIETLQRVENMPYELRIKLQWALYQSTNFGQQNHEDGSGMLYGKRQLPDGSVEIQVIDRLIAEREREEIEAARRVARGEPARPPPPASLWTRFQQTEFYRRWLPAYRTISTLYVLWLALRILPAPLPNAEGVPAVAIEVLRRIAILALAFYSAPLVFLVRFFLHYRIIRRSKLELQPLLVMRGR